jgi:hypothetical protein
MGNARIKVRRSRRQTPGKFKLHKPEWIDPYPQIEGTEPEKRIFAMLMLMGIYFIYQGQVPEFEKGGSKWQTLAIPGYKPDFVLPEYKLIIDPFSPFHHSLKNAVQRDVRKIVTYSAAGYGYYHPWAIGPGLWTWDQYHDSRKTLDLGVTHIRLYGGVNAARNKYRNLSRKLVGQRMGSYEMLRSIPEIQQGPLYKLTDPRDIKAKQSPGYRIGQYIGAGANSVGAANRSRRRPKSLRMTVGTRRTIRRAR